MASGWKVGALLIEQSKLILIVDFLSKLLGQIENRVNMCRWTGLFSRGREFKSVRNRSLLSIVNRVERGNVLATEWASQQKTAKDKEQARINQFLWECATHLTFKRYGGGNLCGIRHSQ